MARESIGLCIVGQSNRLRGVVLRPRGQRKGPWRFHVIYLIISLHFFRVGLIFLLSSQATDRLGVVVCLSQTNLLFVLKKTKTG